MEGLGNAGLLSQHLLSQWQSYTCSAHLVGQTTFKGMWPKSHQCMDMPWLRTNPHTSYGGQRLRDVKEFSPQTYYSKWQDQWCHKSVVPGLKPLLLPSLLSLLWPLPQRMMDWSKSQMDELWPGQKLPGKKIRYPRNSLWYNITLNVWKIIK